MKKKDVLLEIRTYFDEKEFLYMKTRGKLWEKEGYTVIEWDSPESDGVVFKEKSLVSVNGENEITLFSGENTVKPALYLENGRRCVTQAVDGQYLNYVPIGHSVNFIRNTIASNGELQFSYTVDSYTAQNVTKTVSIKILDRKTRGPRDVSTRV